MDLHLKGKVFMVAGASKGLGYGVAEALASEGARVSIASRSLPSIRTAADKLKEKFSSDVHGYACDARDSSTIERWVASTLTDFGAIDGLVINAGGPPAGGFDDFDDKAWNSAFELTLLSAVRMVGAVLPTLRRRESGAILAITSTSIKEPIDMLLLSNVFRSGVSSLVKSLSRDLAREGIRINNLVPGRIDTDRVREIDSLAGKKRNIATDIQRAEQESAIPLGRYGTIEEFGKAAAYLLSDAASYITGATLVVDGGKTRSV